MGEKFQYEVSKMQGKGFLVVSTVQGSAGVPTYGPVGPPVEFSVMCVEINLLTCICFTSVPRYLPCGGATKHRWRYSISYVC